VKIPGLRLECGVPVEFALEFFRTDLSCLLRVLDPAFLRFGHPAPALHAKRRTERVCADERENDVDDDEKLNGSDQPSSSSVEKRARQLPGLDGKQSDGAERPDIEVRERFEQVFGEMDHRVVVRRDVLLAAVGAKSSLHRRAAAGTDAIDDVSHGASAPRARAAA
jgi:hypothetical protein